MNFSMKKDGDFYVSTAGIAGRDTRTFMMPWKEVSELMDTMLSELPFLMHPTYFTLPSGEWGVTGKAFLGNQSYTIDTHNEKYPCYPSNMTLEEVEATDTTTEPVVEEDEAAPVEEQAAVSESEEHEAALAVEEQETVTSTNEPEEQEVVPVVEERVAALTADEPRTAIEPEEKVITVESEEQKVVASSEPKEQVQVDNVNTTTHTPEEIDKSVTEDIPQVISFPAIQAGVNNADKEDIEIKVDITNPVPEYLKSLPRFVFAPIDEWCTNAPDEYLLKEQGDNYCMLNDWHGKDGYFYIDDIKANVRYVHSDMHSLTLVIKFIDVLAQRSA